MGEEQENGTGAATEAGQAAETPEDAAFAAGLLGEDAPAEETPAGADDPTDGKETPEGDTPPEGEAQEGAAAAGEETPAGADDPQDQGESLTLTVGGQAVNIPASAVLALAQAEGIPPEEALAAYQRGRSPDPEQAGALQELTLYAQNAGLSLHDYVQQMADYRRESLLQEETARVQAEIPDTPDAAARAIAQSRISEKEAQQRQAQEQTTQQITAQRERIQQMAAQVKQDALVRAWDAYEQATGIHTAEGIPPRVMELVQGGMSPMEAHYRLQAEEAQQAVQTAKKEATNRGKTPGSSQGAGADSADAFLRGLLGN